MSSGSDDEAIRMSAFAALDQLMIGRTVLPWSEVQARFAPPGFDHLLRFAGRAKGIFKPKEMSGVLSVRTVMPRKGRRVWYKDQYDSRDALYAGDATVRYSFRGDDPASSDNLLLKDAVERRIPIIYFVAAAPAVYVPLYPAFVVDWYPQRLEADLAFAPVTAAGKIATLPISTIERRYRLVEVRQRVHQAEFREAVLDAYGPRCVITGLPVRDLLMPRISCRMPTRIGGSPGSRTVYRCARSIMPTTRTWSVSIRTASLMSRSDCLPTAGISMC